MTEQTGEILQIADSADYAITGEGLLATSRNLGWPGLNLSQWQNIAPQEATEVLDNHLLIVHSTPQAVATVERTEGYKNVGSARPGDLNLISAGETTYCRWDTPLSFLRLDLSASFLQTVAAQTELGNPDRVEIAHRFRQQDTKILQVSHWLLAEIYNGNAGGKLYSDSLVNILAIHLLQTYTAYPITKELRVVSLTQKEVARAIEYMQANLERDLSLEELARVVNISPSYLGRLFKRATSATPHQYLLSLRVNRAKELLLTGQFTIGEVASLIGFADQSHLHRHFKRLFGVTPKAFLPKS